MKIQYKIMLFFILGAAIIIGLLAYFFLLYSNSVITGRINAQLDSVITLKENQFYSFMISQSEETKKLAGSKVITDYMRKFRGPNIVESSINHTLEEESEQEIANAINDRISNSYILSTSIITLDGVVDFSTRENSGGTIKSDEKYFIEGLKGGYIQSFYYNIETQQFSITIAYPIIDGNRTVLGVLADDLNLSTINDIMAERTGLGNTGETLLVNNFNLLVTKSRFLDDVIYKKVINTKAVTQCLKGNSGRIQAKDYRGKDALIRFEWLPEYNTCMLAKIDQSEAFLPIQNLRNIILLTIIGAAILAILMSWALSRSIVIPIIKLVDETKEFAKGNFSKRVDICTKDELQILGDAFNNAGVALADAKSLEQEYNKKLNIDIDIKTKELQARMEDLEKVRVAALNMMEDLTESNKHLKDLDQSKTDFLNIASHELKTPLTAISAYIEILDDYKGQFNEQQLQGLDAIKRNSNQLKILINNILEISRLESGRFEINSNGIDPAVKITNILNNLRILSDNKHLELKSELNPVPKIMTDEMRFEEILNNLVGNAIKFTDKGSITVKLERNDDSIIVSVTDTGVGIAEDKIKNLYQNFYQIDSSISRKYGGTGLGLAITKKMIELQGGKISVTSVFGKGSTFRFTLPMNPKDNNQDKDKQ